MAARSTAANSPAHLVLSNSTVSGNTSSAVGSNSGFYITYGGGGFTDGVFSNGLFVLLNSVVSGNTNPTAPDLQTNAYGYGYAYYSAIGDTNGFNYTGGNNLIGQNLLLTGLQDNGGPTLTMSPQLLSPLIDAGSNGFIPTGVTTDQRGADRIFNSTVDIGAVELQPPQVTINQAPSQNDPTNQGPIVFDVSFTTAVNDFDGSDIDFTGSTVGGTLVATVNQISPSTYTVSVTGMDGTGNVVASIPAGAATDPITGLTSLVSTSTDNIVAFDNVPPTVSIDQGAFQNDPTNLAPVTFDVTFSEPVSGFDASDIDFTGSTIPGLTASVLPTGPTTYIVSVFPPGPSEGIIQVGIPAGAAKDAAGNDNTASSTSDDNVLFDNVPPTVIINQTGTADPVGGLSVSFDVLFSEPVFGFDASDIDLTGTNAPGATAHVSGTGPAYTVTVDGMTDSGLVVASIPGGAVTDIGGNFNNPSTSTDNSVTYIRSGTLQFSLADYATTELNGPTVTVTVTRVGGDEGPLSVDYATSDGSATAGSDYTATSGTLNFADGELSKTFDVQILDDTVFEGGRLAPAEKVNLTLSNISLVGALGEPTATVSITDYEEGTLSFSDPVFTTAESENGAIVMKTITVTRTLGTDGQVTVDFTTGADTAHAGTDYTTTSGTLTFGQDETTKTFDVPILDDNANEGIELANLTLSNPISTPPGELPLLGTSTATMQIDASDGLLLKAIAKQNKGSLTDVDGDTVTLILGGGVKKGNPVPTAKVYITDPDGDGQGPIELIRLTDTDAARTTLTVQVKKPKVPKGTTPPVTDVHVGLGAIEKDPLAVAPVGLKLINAPLANLDGAGIHMDAYLGKAVLGNVEDGADIVTTGGTADQKQKTTLRLGIVGDVHIDVVNPISSLNAISFGDGSITAPAAGSIVTRSQKANVKKGLVADPGDFLADLTLNGAGVLLGKPTLGTLNVKGNILDSTISIEGKVNSVRAATFRDSRFFDGYTGPDAPADSSGFDGSVALGSFVTTGVKAEGFQDSFQNSYVVASTIRLVSLRSVDITNAVDFGVYADQSIKKVISKLPAFKYTPQLNGNFERDSQFVVQIVPPGPVPPSVAQQSAVAVHEVATNGYVAPEGLVKAVTVDGTSLGELSTLGTPVKLSDSPASLANLPTANVSTAAVTSAQDSTTNAQVPGSAWDALLAKLNLNGTRHRTNFLGQGGLGFAGLTPPKPGAKLSIVSAKSPAGTGPRFK